jgi:hypothetical protein
MLSMWSLYLMLRAHYLFVNGADKIKSGILSHVFHVTFKQLQQFLSPL